MTDYHSEPEQRCCWCCCSFIFTSGLTALFLWLSLRTFGPTCSIEQFDAFALHKAAKSTQTKSTDHTLYYDLKLKNRNKDMEACHDAFYFSFYYSSKQIGNATCPAFYQGHQKATHRIGTFDATRGVNWENTTATVSSNGSAVFRVELATKRNCSVWWWRLTCNLSGELSEVEEESGHYSELRSCYDQGLF